MRNRNAPYFTGELQQTADDLAVLIAELRDTIKNEYIPFRMDKELINAQLSAAITLHSITTTRIKLRQGKYLTAKASIANHNRKLSYE